MQHCPACKKATLTAFCPDCGEFQHPQRFSIQKVLLDVPNAIINWEKGLLHTVKSLALKPGTMIREYLAGARAQYYRPMNFVFLVAGLYTLLFSIVDIRSSAIGAAQTKWDAYADQLLQYQGFILLMQLPFFSLVSWLMFYKRRYYYGEHLLGNAYITGQITIFQLIMYPVYLWVNHTVGVDIVGWIYFVFILAFGYFAYYDWFYRKKGFEEGWLSFAAIFTNMLVLMLTNIPLLRLTVQIKRSIFGGD